jgi:hypothetical protein
MKKLITIAALTIACATASASTICQTVGKLAYTMMDARQAGLSLTELLAMPSRTPLGRTILLDAYESPRFHTEEMQERAKVDFRNKWELACVKSRSKDGTDV